MHLAQEAEIQPLGKPRPVALKLCQPKGAELIPPLKTEGGHIFLIGSTLFSSVCLLVIGRFAQRLDSALDQLPPHLTSTYTPTLYPGPRFPELQPEPQGSGPTSTTPASEPRVVTDPRPPHPPSRWTFPTPGSFLILYLPSRSVPDSSPPPSPQFS